MPREIGVTLFATAFDMPSLEFLEELDMPAYKVASGDITNIPLIRAIASTGKPMIISTGAGTLDDVLRAHVAASELNPQVAVLQCTAAYPPDWEELDLRVIETYRDLFPTSVVGFSSHDSGIAMAIAAYVLGARIVEKHFTLNRAMKGTDHAFSLEPQGLAKMVRDLRRTRAALGDGAKRMFPSEAEPAVKMGKKLVAARELPAGHVLTKADVEARSPGDGLPPYELDRIVGRALRRPVTAETTLTLELLEDELPTGSMPLARADAALSASSRARSPSLPEPEAGSAPAGAGHSRTRAPASSASTSKGVRESSRPTFATPSRCAPSWGKSGRRTSSSTMPASISRPRSLRHGTPSRTSLRAVRRDARREPPGRLPLAAGVWHGHARRGPRLDREHRVGLRDAGARPSPLRTPPRRPAVSEAARLRRVEGGRAEPDALLRPPLGTMSAFVSTRYPPAACAAIRTRSSCGVTVSECRRGAWQSQTT